MAAILADVLTKLVGIDRMLQAVLHISLQEGIQQRVMCFLAGLAKPHIQSEGLNHDKQASGFVTASSTTSYSRSSGKSHESFVWWSTVTGRGTWSNPWVCYSESWLLQLSPVSQLGIVFVQRTLNVWLSEGLSKPEKETDVNRKRVWHNWLEKKKEIRKVNVV